MTHHRFFVTGTDTDVGKTFISCALLHLARQHGLTTAAGKPVASGSRMTDGGLRNSDAEALLAECQPPLAYSRVNPIALAPAIAPHIAATEAGIALSVADLHTPMRQLLDDTPADFTLIEGAGGWRVPLNERETLADLAKALHLDVILVVGVKLGAINHARLTLEAIERDGLKVAGWVANLVDAKSAQAPQQSRLAQNLDALRQWLPAPCLGVVPHLPCATAANAASYLSLTPLLARSTPHD
ncbi:dethiobiotin synthase [Carnimonas nigrificans]|uniref:dethiobiotin synthase n=1 Tax=Carnimonas nigrificans TaxID=64323 RepID=UPI00047234A3|nr:dethiobiotin synthase [Carnimonas nigrificans]